ncbi:nitroreductase family protein [Peptoniphilus equinus]|uniref:Nitroreductase family protein n=1 Tax=Peptoniphilus equinus TaxID=3016343 RepID=A0ABY7QRY9_9FIRM|nr:nitroreductase family protein [Peptoniphilus equinus]WBW49548.1 nitroreductase family protein [Peptoniphilus equinus]
MLKNFQDAIAQRRTHYVISKEPVLSDDEIKALVEHVVIHTPSAFNSQTARLVVLLGQEHDKFWDITMDALREVVPEDSFSATEDKINGFKAGYGTVLFYEDQDGVKALQEQFPLYAQNFPIWSKEASGMHQFNVWTSLTLAGYGASLQHYTELIDQQVKDAWDIPKSWELRGQMPFGKAGDEAGDKDVKPVEERVKIYK